MIVQHYKGNLYCVIGVGLSTDNLQSKVIYEAGGTNQIWVRDYNEFVDGRFKLVYPLTQHIAPHLRGLADALERNSAEFVAREASYKMNPLRPQTPG